MKDKGGEEALVLFLFAMASRHNQSVRVSTPILEIRHLEKSYPDFALKHINLVVNAGTIVGLLGRNGAGKSTLIKCMLGLIPSDSGTFMFHGEEVSYGSNVWRQAVGYVAESHPLYDWMSVERFLHFLSSYYSTWDHQYCQQLLRRFDIDAGKRIRDLSHGMRVKVALIAALAYHPILLVLDEPTSGLDPAARAEFLDELRDEIARRSPTPAVLMSSHVLEDITRVADEVVIIREGELVMHARLSELMDAWRMLSFRVPVELEARYLAEGRRMARQRDGSTFLLCSVDQLSAVETRLRAMGVEEFQVREPTLQEIFLTFA